MEVLREVAGGSIGSAKKPEMRKIRNVGSAGNAEIPETLEMPQVKKIHSDKVKQQSRGRTAV